MSDRSIKLDVSPGELDDEINAQLPWDCPFGLNACVLTQWLLDKCRATTG